MTGPNPIHVFLTADTFLKLTYKIINDHGVPLYYMEGCNKLNLSDLKVKLKLKK